MAICSPCPNRSYTSRLSRCGPGDLVHQSLGELEDERVLGFYLALQGATWTYGVFPLAQRVCDRRAKIEDLEGHSSYRDAVKRFSPRSRAMMSR